MPKELQRQKIAKGWLKEVLERFAEIIDVFLLNRAMQRADENWSPIGGRIEDVLEHVSRYLKGLVDEAIEMCEAVNAKVENIVDASARLKQTCEFLYSAMSKLGLELFETHFKISPKEWLQIRAPVDDEETIKTTTNSFSEEQRSLLRNLLSNLADNEMYILSLMNLRRIPMQSSKNINELKQIMDDFINKITRVARIHDSLTTEYFGVGRMSYRRNEKIKECVHDIRSSWRFLNRTSPQLVKYIGKTLPRLEGFLIGLAPYDEFIEEFLKSLKYYKTLRHKYTATKKLGWYEREAIYYLWFTVITLPYVYSHAIDVHYYTESILTAVKQLKGTLTEVSNFLDGVIQWAEMTRREKGGTQPSEQGEKQSP